MSPLVAYFLFINCVVLPYACVRAFLKLQVTAPPEVSRRKLYAQSIIQVGLLTVFAVFIAQFVRMVLFLPWKPKPLEIGLGIVLLLGWFALREALMPWILKTAPPNRLYRMPTNGRQLLLWSCVSLVAGVGEEIIYRGVLFNSFVWWTHAPIAAAIITAATFGFVHIIQGVRSAIFISLMALSMQGLVVIAGSLYMAMIVHVAFDFAVGLRYVLFKPVTATP